MSDSADAPAQIHNHDASSIAPQELAPHTNGVKLEHAEESPLQNGSKHRFARDAGHRKRNVRDGDEADASSKRRRVSSASKMGLSPRAVSPPWQFGSVDKATLVVDGKRRSARTTATSSPAPVKEEEKRPRRTSASKNKANHAALHNGVMGQAKSSKQTSIHRRTRSSESQTQPSPTFKRPSKPMRRIEPPSLKTTNTTTRSRRSSGVNKPLEKPAPSPTQRTSTRRTSGRSETLREQPGNETMTNTNSAPGHFQKLKLRLREPKLGRTHPAHWPRPRRFASFQEWLDNDDALEGETDVPIKEEDLQKEIQARLRIVRASQPGGLLTEGRCTKFLEGSRREPPIRYGVWDHLCAHAINFHNLLGKEKERHKKWAKQLATLCQLALATEDRWSKVREQKSAEEIQQEQLDYQVRRYRQVVKDMSGAWEGARIEVNKIRFEQWEREQEALGKKALDEMLDHSTQLLWQHHTRDSSEYPSEARSSVAPTGSETGTGRDDSDHGSSDRSSEDDDDASEDSENMSEPSDGEEEDEVDAQNDDDANLSPEALRRKYAIALEQEVHESSNSEDDGTDQSEDHGSGAEVDSVAESDNDTDLDAEEDEPSLLSLMLPKTLRSKLSPSQPHDKSEEVDSKMDSSGTADDAASAVGSEQAVPELEEVDDILMDDSDEESTDMNDEDSDSGSSGTGASDAEIEESDEELGLMGFYAKPKKKPIEEPAATIDAEQADDEPMTGDILTQDHTDDVQEMEVVVQDDSSTEIVKRDLSRPDTPQTPIEPGKTEVPSLLLRGSLRAYQHDGLDWLAKLYSGSRNGILADEMGLGKTIQTISLLAHLAVHHKIWGPHLVVVPTSVMLNWEMEFKKWLPGFKILTYYGDIEERRRKRQGWLNDDKWNVCIASYQLILKDAQAFKKRSWHYLILDEAHYIKNFQSQKWQTLLTFKTHSRLLLTGTPLQNDLQELWSLLYFLMPAGLDGSGGFADLEKFLNSMKRPADQILNQGQQKLDAEAQARVNKLHEVLRPFLLRRLKSEVEKQMPGKYEHVVYCRLSKRQRQLYDEFMARSDTRRTLASGNYMSIMNCLMSLRKVCNHPDLFETRQIVTSFAMPKSAVANYEIRELFVRRRFLQLEDSVDLEHLGFVPTVFEKHSRLSQFRRYHLRAVEPLQGLVERQSRRLRPTQDIGYSTVKDNLRHLENDAERSVLSDLKNCLMHARRTTDQWPIYGTDFVGLMTMPNRFFPPQPKRYQLRTRDTGDWYTDDNCLLVQNLMPSLPEVAQRCESLVVKFTCLTPAVVAEDVKEYALTRKGMQLVQEAQAKYPAVDPYHEARIRSSIAFPDKRLLQYDCGKLQALANLLRELQSGGHRCLIFTQMTKVLDILEQFLNIHGHRYLRLDGSTKIEQRQILTDRFNNDTRILAFILSSRSGGLGINLTGADTVIFYDLDWNPAMDAQCQDRCHRIGQTRDVHIYRFISEHTIEANILRKSNQKRLLDDVIIQKGEFTTDYFNRVTYKDAFADAEELEGENAEASAAMDRVLGEVTGLGTVLDSVEDREDAVAAKEAQKEAIYNADDADFNDSSNQATGSATTPREGTHAPGIVDQVVQAARDMAADEKGAVDEWMVRYLDGFEMKGMPVLLPKAVVNAQRNKARRGRDYRRRR